MIRDAIRNAAHSDGNPRGGQMITEHLRAIWVREYRLINVFANFAFVDIKSSHHFNITGCVAPDFPVHEADGIYRALITIIVNSLYQ